MKLIGVFPESQVSMPKINPTQKYPNQLANGHTHLFMLTGKTGAWGSESRLKYNLAKVLALGDRESMRLQKSTGLPKHMNTDPACKIVYVLLGDSDVNEWIEDLRIVDSSHQAVDNQLPVIVVKGSKMCDAIIDHINGKNKMRNEGSPRSAEFEKMLDDGHFYALESGRSEDIAAFAHFFLTVTPYTKKPKAATK